MNHKKKKQDDKDKTYNIRPAFKDKFRPNEAKEHIEKIVRDKVQDATFNPQEIAPWTKEIADNCKKTMQTMGKDKRYKYMIQCIIG